jgi:hypothetical protein
MHECLLTEEEGWYADYAPAAFLLSPTTSARRDLPIEPYTSDGAHKLTREELAELLENV